MQIFVPLYVRDYLKTGGYYHIHIKRIAKMKENDLITPPPPPPMPVM